MWRVTADTQISTLESHLCVLPTDSTQSFHTRSSLHLFLTPLPSTAFMSLCLPGQTEVLTVPPLDISRIVSVWPPAFTSNTSDVLCCPQSSIATATPHPLQRLRLRSHPAHGQNTSQLQKQDESYNYVTYIFFSFVELGRVNLLKIKSLLTSSVA